VRLCEALGAIGRIDARGQIMVNDHEANEAHEDGLTPHCGYCGNPLIGQRPDALYCSRTCKQKASAKRRRTRERVDTYRASYPDASHAWDGPPDDDNDHEHQDQDDDGQSTLLYLYGHSGDFLDRRKVQEAIDAIDARYERLMAPFRAQLRRNAGVRLPGLVALERERDDEISRMVREYERADELNRARRDEPRRLNEAHERQTERAALQALGNQLPGRARRTQAPNVGRATRDVWHW
jgi:hypothetical protein